MITLDQHIANIKGLRDRMVEESRPLFLASQSALGEMADRIFEDGKTISGGRYQYNNNKPLYVNPQKTFGDTSSLKPPRGKAYNGKPPRTVFASTGKDHKTTYVESYKQLRGLVGRETSFVNFVADGDLRSEFVNRSLKQKANEVDIVISENAGKVDGLMNKYPQVFELSQKEKEVFQTNYRKETLKLLREGLRS